MATSCCQGWCASLINNLDNKGDDEGNDEFDNGRNPRPRMVRVRILDGNVTPRSHQEEPPDALSPYVSTSEWLSLQRAIREALGPARHHNQCARVLNIGISVVIVLGLVLGVIVGVSGYWSWGQENDDAAVALVAAALGLVVVGTASLLLLQLTLTIARRCVVQPDAGKELRLIFDEFSTDTVQYHLFQDGDTVAGSFFCACNGSRGNEAGYIGTDFVLIVTVMAEEQVVKHGAGACSYLSLRDGSFDSPSCASSSSSNSSLVEKGQGQLGASLTASLSSFAPASSFGSDQRSSGNSNSHQHHTAKAYHPPSLDVAGTPPPPPSSVEGRLYRLRNVKNLLTEQEYRRKERKILQSI